MKAQTFIAMLVSVELTDCGQMLRNPDMGAGVATAGPYPGSGDGANYRHPTTGNLEYCRKPLVVGALSAHRASGAESIRDYPGRVLTTTW